MKYAIVFITLGLTCAYHAVTAHNPFLRFLTASTAIAFSAVGLAYAFNRPGVFLKQANGRLNPWSYLLLWPFQLLNWLSLLAFRAGGKENAFDRIDDNIILGCRLSRGDQSAIQELGVAAVLDLTCEFAELPTLRRQRYYCIPLLDTYAPTLAQLEAGVAWVQENARHGPVYVHCALGHGRSASFVAAYLIAIGKANTPAEAEAAIRLLRPKIGLGEQQAAVLEEYCDKTKSR